MHHQELGDVSRATGAGEVCEDFISNLSRISQPTVSQIPFIPRHTSKYTGSISCLVRSYVLVWKLVLNPRLDVLLVNQTADTLQSLWLDFATLGDLKS